MSTNSAVTTADYKASLAQRNTGSWPLVRRIVATNLAPYKWRLAAAVLFMLLASGATGALAKLMEPVMDQVLALRDGSWLVPLAAAIFGILALRGLSTFAHSVLMNFVSQRIVADLQHKLYRKLLDADVAFFHATSAGHLMSRVINDVQVMRESMAECMTSIGRSGLTLLVLTGLMFYQDWVLALAAFIAFPTTLFVMIRLGRHIRRVSGKTQTEVAHLSTFLNQTFQGIRHVKAYGMEAFERRRVGNIVERMFELSKKIYTLSAITTPVADIVGGLAIVTVILYGGFRVLEGASSPGELMSFITAFLLSYEPLKRLSKLNARLQRGLAAADRVYALLDAEPTVVDRPGAGPLKIDRCDIRFENVHFSYGEDAPALHGIDLVVPHGMTVALVGPSGAGKSTILNLIPRFFDVTSGRITVGGTDVRDVTMASLRAHLALVSQETALFDDSIRANIAYGRQDASDTEIKAAAEAAAAHDFISALPDGYDTLVGENGLKLSGGQRQRIAIARAVLRDAPILLLDEATSALDNESERLVQAALGRLRQGRTTLVIAHRLSTIADADRIYVLDKGRVVEAGQHGELISKGGLYYRFYGLQVRDLEDAPPPAVLVS